MEITNKLADLSARIKVTAPAKLSTEHVPFVIHHANLVRTLKGIDGLGLREGSIAEDHSLAIDAQGLIEDIFPSSDQARAQALSDGHKSIDAQGRYILPGLINAHAHVFGSGKGIPLGINTKDSQAMAKSFLQTVPGQAFLRKITESNIRQALLSGVTTLRTVGDIAYDTVALRDRINDGETVGPRILASGPLLAIHGGHGAPLIALEGDSEEEIISNVHQLLDHGVDVIKIAATGGVTDSQVLGEAGQPQMTEENMRLICQEAHKAGVMVAAHAQSLEGTKRALKAGVDTIEHGSTLDQEVTALYRKNPNSLRGWSAVIPTLSAMLPTVSLDQDELGMSDVARSNSAQVGENLLTGLREAVAKNLHVGVGTDSAMPYVTQYNTWRELDYLVRYAGMAPAQAIYAATGANAEILGLDQMTGSLTIGLAADLLVVEGNPLDDLRALDKPALVVAGGIPVWRPHAKHFPAVDQALDTI